jgi:predicted transcriptional regulator
MSTDTHKDENTPTLKIIEEIRNGLRRFLDQDDPIRKEIVTVLRLEGQKVSNIAQMLGCSDKSVQRTIAAARKDAQLAPSSEFIKETIGDMARLAYQHWCSLVRIAKSTSSSTREKIDAETAAWNVIRDYIEQLRKVGYLPSAAQEVIGKISHEVQMDGDRTWDQMKLDLVQLRLVASKTNGMTPDLEKEIRCLEEKTEKASVQESIERIILTNKLNEETGNHD